MTSPHDPQAQTPDTPHVTLHVGAQEYRRRYDALQELMSREELDGVCLFSQIWIQYVMGFTFQPTERPVCLLLLRGGPSEILVPELERDHVGTSIQTIDQITCYPEYPGERHPMSYLADMLARVGLTGGRIGCDREGYGGYWGSRGPTLRGLVPMAEIISILDALQRMRQVKSPAELDALRESARQGQRAHDLLIAAFREGESELVISQRASADATAMLLEAMPPGYAVTQWGSTPAHVGIKAGPETAWPHPMGGGRALRHGDHVNTWSLVAVDGYRAELERTLFFGTPNASQVEAFEQMLALQMFAIDTLAPGRRCSDVEREVQAFARQRGLTRFLRHHTGHALGLESHEPPFLDLGDATVLEPGMVFSVEPGLYITHLGGFRHSDTVAITNDGIEVLTTAPRELDGVVISAP